jgi:hypothetical protein
MHWFDFETTVSASSGRLSVKVEATLSSDGYGDVDIEGVKILLLNSETGEPTGNELLPNKEQAADIREEIWERVRENVNEDRGADYDEE